MKFISCRIFIILLCCLCSNFSTATDPIKSFEPITDPQTITSNGRTFKLGFFTPGDKSSTKRYVGIWYNNPSETVVWVANRNRPLNDSSGVLTISENGNLIITSGGEGEVIWSSHVSDSVNGTKARLLDTGNLVLYDNTTGTELWESFQEPGNTFLSGMRLSYNTRTGEKKVLTSWKSASDPSIGSFSFGVDALNLPEAFIWKDNHTHVRSGPWNKQGFIGIPNMIPFYLRGFDFQIDNQQGTGYLTFAFGGERDAYFVLNTEGKIIEIYRADGTMNWVSLSSFPGNECDVYGRCGTFGKCNSRDTPICSCLRGFEPRNMKEWSKGNWSGGCVRMTPLQCESSMNLTGKEGKPDGFLRHQSMKAPDFAERSSAAEDECEEMCLNNCSCIAFAYDAGIGCMIWSTELIDVQKFSSNGVDLYIRVAHSELDKRDMKVTVIVIVNVIVGILAVGICAFFSWRWMAKRKAMKGNIRRAQFGKAYANMNVEIQDLPLFNFEKLATATNNFSPSNKLGQGGFGPVYKGTLQNGQEIAVKRLSKVSGQGEEEFMNEVVVICKLQHRNLVRLLGCCVEREEKMLVYEYMPNKSFDALLFDPLNHEVLDWRKRFNIIEGISRGLLYLHRDSRLRIIHRDLKASNILLDKDLNPKIADFGTARIFGGDQNEANTARIVGTYGYMSPEYVSEGRFSEKSDVFSFGVLLLEVISGRKTMSFYHDEHFLSLLGYAWKLWNEDNIDSFIDPAMSDSCNKPEVLRCINVGLLCVQEFMKDRPSMQTIVSMLNSEIVDLPVPKKPAFTERQSSLDSKSSAQGQQKYSVNNVTVTILDGR